MTGSNKQQELYNTLSESLKDKSFDSPVEMCKELLTLCDSNYVIDMMLRDRFGLGIVECAKIRKQAAKS